MSYVGAGQNKYTVFPLENYTFGKKAPKVEKQRTIEARFAHLREQYARDGMRRSVDAVVLVHMHSTVHVLLLQPNQHFFRLPGGRVRPGEDEVACLQRKLTRSLAPEKSEELQLRWQVGDCLGRFYRPNFETLFYPYCPTHIERPKEVKKVFLVALPERAFLTIPRNMRLIAVPLFELYDHAMKYGAVISSIPLLVSRLILNLAQPGVPRELMAADTGHGGAVAAGHPTPSAPNGNALPVHSQNIAQQPGQGRAIGQATGTVQDHDFYGF